MGFRKFSGGFIGVDVFFVISGFLITSILKKDLDSGQFSFWQFWKRRIRRILPALIIVVLATLGFAQLFVFKPDRPLIATRAMAALLSVANIYFWQTNEDYWGHKSEDSPFLHTWSLSVEEQFYLLFPFLFYLLYRYKPQWVSGFLLGCILSSLSLFLYGSIRYPSATFYLLPTRAWELATGCYLGILLRDQTVKHESKPILSQLGMAGLGLIIVSYVLIPNLNGSIALAVIGTSLVILFGNSGLCNLILSNRFVVHVGKLSYSLYLWHWPVLVFANVFGSSSKNWLLLIPVYLLSLLSYYFVETPARRLKNTIPAILGCYFITLVLTSVSIYMPPFYDFSDFEKQQYLGQYYNNVPPYKLSQETINVFATLEIPRREGFQDAFRNGGIIIGDNDGSNPRVVVLGDSHGSMWADVIVSITRKLGIKTSIITTNGINPFIRLPVSLQQKQKYFSSQEKYEYDMSRLNFIKMWKPDLVIICCKWSLYRQDETIDLLDFLEIHSKRTLLMEQPPELGFGNRNAMQYLIYKGIKPEMGIKRFLPIGNASNVQSGREMIRKLAKIHTNVNIIPIYDLFNEKEESLVLDGKNVVYMDDDHLTAYGARLAKTRIEQSILAELEKIKP